MKLWKKDYDVNFEIESYCTDNDYVFDQRLVPYDCKASIAHATMLNKIGIINKQELKLLILGLNEIITLHKDSKFIVKKDDEDCHTAIENYLTAKYGKVGKKIHTARSRNDQVATAIRLYMLDSITTTKNAASNLIKTFQSFKKKYGKIPMPGYTHMRKAMPSSIELWSNAFLDSLKDDILFLDSVYNLVNQNPLGSGAGYGIPLNIDKKLTTKLMGFAKLQENPIYVQMSRGKFEALVLHALTSIMFDLNKLATDLIIYSMDKFGYFELPKEFCTGSSIMPQKYNPDPLEIMRGKYHQVLSFEFQILSTIGNLTTGYHREFQLTKSALMQSFDITISSLHVADLIISKLEVNSDKCKKAMTKELFATQKAYKLVKQGVPFREAYLRVAKEYQK